MPASDVRFNFLAHRQREEWSWPLAVVSSRFCSRPFHQDKQFRPANSGSTILIAMIIALYLELAMVHCLVLMATVGMAY